MTSENSKIGLIYIMSTIFTMLTALNYVYINQEIKGFYQFEIIINVLVISFCYN